MLSTSIANVDSLMLKLPRMLGGKLFYSLTHTTYLLYVEEYTRLLIAAADCKCARISIRVYAPEPNARFRTGQGGLRGRRSTGHEESEIDKAHVLHAAESPWLEVSTVGLSCRLLIAGTMQQMALIAIPTLRSSRSRILLRSLSLAF